MTVGQELLLLDFSDCYYQSISALEVIDPTDLFTTVDEAVYHKTWHGLCVIRRLSPIDLTMTSYSYSLRCVSLYPVRGDGRRRGCGAEGEQRGLLRRAGRYSL